MNLESTRAIRWIKLGRMQRPEMGREEGRRVCAGRELLRLFIISIVSILLNLATLVEKCKPYIKRRRGQTANDPSASLTAPDGSDDDCMRNH